MRTNILILIICFVAIAGFTFAYDFLMQTPRSSKISTLSTAQKQSLKSAPDVNFTDLDGQSFTLNDLKGKTVLLNFWATWCPPCVVEFPQMLKIANTHDDIVFVAVSVDTTSNVITTFLKKQNQQHVKSKNVMIVHDPNKEISQDIFQVIKYPETIIIDKNTMMKDKIIGAVDWMSPEILSRISQ